MERAGAGRGRSPSAMVTMGWKSCHSPLIDCLALSFENDSVGEKPVCGSHSQDD